MKSTKGLRTLAALSLAFMPLFFASSSQAAQTGPVQITCEKNGTQGTYQVGWDNSNQFFMGKGNIAALYCTGGFSPLRDGATYVSDTLTDEPLRYYNGVIPTPAPEPSSSPVVSESSSVSSESPVPTDSSSVSSESSESQTTSPAPEPTNSPETQSQSVSEVATESSLSAPSIQWEYIVNEGSILEAEAPAGKIFSGAVAWYVAHDSNCGIDVSSVVAAVFNGTTASSISADNSVFGDPCPGEYKKLTVTFVYETLAAPTPQPEPQPEPSPEPVTPQPEPEPEVTPEPTEEPSPIDIPAPEPEPTEQPSPEPVETPEPPVVVEPENLESTQEPLPSPDPSPSEEPTPEPELEPEEPVETPEITAEAPIEELLDAVAEIKPSELTSAQIEILSEAALETFATAEQGSEEYLQALEVLAVIAEADDEELPAELAAIPFVGDVAGAVLEVFNDIGNIGADMAPEQREKAEETVIAAVIVGQVAQVASAAAASASVAASNRKIK
jgi:hypothetical protein